MKLRYLLLLSLLASACHEHEWFAGLGSTPIEIAAPIIELAADSLPFNGMLAALPCNYNTSTYYGNYNSSGTLGSSPGYYYYVSDTLNSVTPLILPIGNYSILYWGYPSFYTDKIGDTTTPPISIGSNFANLYYTLTPRSNDTTYYPSQQLAYAIQNVAIGTNPLSAYLTRVTALLNIIVNNVSSSALSTVDSMWVTIGNISNSVNIYTAAASNPTKTVSVGLTPNSTNSVWSVYNVSVFPSGATPPINLFILLTSGIRISSSQVLSVTLAPSSQTTVTYLLNLPISVKEPPSIDLVKSLEVSTETIDTPIILKGSDNNRTF